MNLGTEPTTFGHYSWQERVDLCQLVHCHSCQAMVGQPCKGALLLRVHTQRIWDFEHMLLTLRQLLDHEPRYW